MTQDTQGHLSTVFSFEDQILFTVSGTTDNDDESYITDPTLPFYTDNSWIESPWIDFGSTNVKLLTSAVIRFLEVWDDTEWDFYLLFRTTEETGWVLLGSASDQTPALRWVVPISRPPNPGVEFDRIQFQLVFQAQVGSPTSWPKITSIEFQAQMVQKFKTFELLLQCYDEDAQHQHRSLRGADQIDNVQTLGDLTVPFVFLDGYTDREPSKYDTYHVVIDEYRNIGGRPGEGVAWVRLVEVAGTSTADVTQTEPEPPGE